MPQQITLVGIGMGNPDHLTAAAMRAIAEAKAILLPRKGAGKDDLAQLREALIDHCGSKAQILYFDYPVRDETRPYIERVNLWHDEIAARWQAAIVDAGVTGPVALLVWGDPALYDSTMRIASRLQPKPQLQVIPGLTAPQILTAAHQVPINRLNGQITITTGRRLRDHGWPEGADSVAVMLDGDLSFRQIDLTGLHIWWGAFLGMPEQILIEGPAAQVAEDIADARAAARADHGWIMDTYLLKKMAQGA